MNNIGNDIETLFKNKLESNSVAPPDNLWESLSGSLDDTFVEDIYKEKLQDDKKKPPVAIWYSIQQKLWWQQFLTFKLNTVNVYYVSSFVLLTLLGISLLDEEPADIAANFAEEQVVEIKKGDKDETTSVKHADIVEIDNDIEHDLLPSVTKNDIKGTDDEVSNNNKEEVNIAGLAPKNVKNVNSDIQRETLVNKPKIPFDFSQVALGGNKKICKKTPERYTASGLNELVTSTWEIREQAGTIIKQTTNYIEVVWQQPGQSEVVLTVLAGDDKKTVTLPIEIHESINNEIKGQHVVCQGDEEVQYNITNAKDLNKNYIWDVKNPFDIKGNGCILVDWLSPGKDTLYLIDKNNETGCNFRLEFPVEVLPKPSSKIKIIDHGNGAYTFKDASLCQINASCEFTSKWNIDGTTYEDNKVVMQFDNTTSIFIELETTDGNGCSDVQSKEVKVYLHRIETASGVSPAKPFIPMSSDKLKKYHLQIFDESRNKIWETTDLENGFPAVGWDGTYKGAILPEGNFYWQIEAVFEDGAEWKGQDRDGKKVQRGTIYLYRE